jgi:hypothetical protein
MWDLAHRHLVMPGGALTDSRVIQMITNRALTVRASLLAEQSRWGNDTTLTMARWERARQMYINWIIAGSNATIGTNLHNEPVPATVVQPTGPGRAATIISQLRGYMEGVSSTAGTAPAGGWLPRPLYPNLNAPLLSQYGGVVLPTAPVVASLPVVGSSAVYPAGTVSAGVIMVTLDGSDPREIGGSVRSTALSITPGAALPLTGSGKVKARTYDASAVDLQQRWSALVEAEFIVGEPASSSNLVISEINYNPASRSAGEIQAGILDRDEFEFIELYNILPDKHVELTGVRFVAGVEFDFSSASITRLAPGQRLLIVRNPAAFALRYPNVSPSLIAGSYTGGLDNGGELISLVGVGGSIHSFSYDDAAPWPNLADGDGPTLVLLNPTTAPAHAQGGNWVDHTTLGGNPGGGDSTGWLLFAALNGLADPASDGDEDGLTDLEEYALGSDPTVMNAGPLQGFTQMPLTTERIAFTRRQGVTDAQVGIQISNELTSWATTPATILSTTPNGDGTEQVVVEISATTGTRRFIRLVVSLLP